MHCHAHETERVSTTCIAYIITHKEDCAKESIKSAGEADQANIEHVQTVTHPLVTVSLLVLLLVDAVVIVLTVVAVDKIWYMYPFLADAGRTSSNRERRAAGCDGMYFSLSYAPRRRALWTERRALK